MAKRKIDYLILIKFPATYGCHIEYYGKRVGRRCKGAIEGGWKWMNSYPASKIRMMKFRGIMMTTATNLIPI